MSSSIRPVSNALSKGGASPQETSVTSQVEITLRPWERQPGETTLQYSFFKVYLEMQLPRTVRGAYLYW
jgi:hypothetical protein